MRCSSHSSSWVLALRLPRPPGEEAALVTRGWEETRRRRGDVRPPGQHPALSARRHLGPSSSGARQLIAAGCASPPVKQRNHPAKCTVRTAGQSLLFSATKFWSGLLCRHRTERGALQGDLMLSLVCVCVCVCVCACTSQLILSCETGFCMMPV